MSDIQPTSINLARTARPRHVAPISPLDEAVEGLINAVAALKLVAEGHPEHRIFGWHVVDLVDLAKDLRCRHCGRAATLAEQLCRTCALAQAAAVGMGLRTTARDLRAEPEIRTALHRIADDLTDQAADELKGAGVFDDMCNALRVPLGAGSGSMCALCGAVDGCQATCGVDQVLRWQAR